MMVDFLRALRASLLLSCALAVLGPSALAADAYPSKPVRIIVPVAAGGNLDNVIRAMSERLAANLGQPVIVENRPSASSIVGSKLVKGSPPDGYTLLAMANTMLSAWAIIPDIGYDPIADFAYVTQIALIPNILVVPAASPVRTVPQLIELAKTKSGGLSYGSAGNGSVGHFAAEKFSREVGIKLLHVPYKGNGPAMVDLMGGRLDLMFDQVSTSAPQLKAGNIRALAVTTKARSPVLPDVPTMEEAGVKDFEDITFNGLTSPAGTPREILVKLHAEIAKVMQTPELRDRFNAQGIELTPSASPDAFTEYIKSETARMAKLARDANIRADQ
jgi:tripartite-type tricarboxylate transporter receptor subunit TctC